MLCALPRFIHAAAGIYSWVVIGAVLVSWLRADPTHPIVRFLHRATDSVFLKARKLLPLDVSGLDLSPLIVIVAIYVVEWLSVAMIRSIGACQ